MSKVIAGGAFSLVLDHPSKNQVILTGLLVNDALKLGLYASLGMIHNFKQITPRERTDQYGDSYYTDYIAVIDRLFDDNTSFYQTITEHVSLGRDLYRNARAFYAQDSSGSWAESLLLEYATNPQLSDKVTHMCLFLLEFNLTQFMEDNHAGNWLVDNEGDCLPLDVFNPTWGQTPQTTIDTVLDYITGEN